MPELVIYRNTVDNTSNLYDYPMVLARILMIPTMVMSITINVNPARNALKSLLLGEGEANFLTTSTILTSTMIISLNFPEVLNYFKILGGLFSVISGFIYPCMFAYKTAIPNSQKTFMLILTIIISTIGFSSVARVIL